MLSIRKLLNLRSEMCCLDSLLESYYGLNVLLPMWRWHKSRANIRFTVCFSAKVNRSMCVCARCDDNRAITCRFLVKWVYICAWLFGIDAHVLLFDPHSTLWMHFVSASYNRFFCACVYRCVVVVVATKATYQNKQTVRFFVLLQEACIFIQVAREFTEIEWKKERKKKRTAPQAFQL